MNERFESQNDDETTVYRFCYYFIGFIYFCNVEPSNTYGYLVQLDDKRYELRLLKAQGVMGEVAEWRIETRRRKGCGFLREKLTETTAGSFIGVGFTPTEVRSCC